MTSLDTYFKQCRVIAEHIRLQTIPLQKTLESVRIPFESIRTTVASIKTSIKPLLPDHEQWRRIFAAAYRPIIDPTSLSPVISGIYAFQKKFQATVGRELLQFHIAFLELPKHIQKTLLLLGQHGWYLDPDMPLPVLKQFKMDFIKGNIAKAESDLVEYFDSRVNAIEMTLTTKHSDRSHLISAAFRAHYRGEWELSIPVFLAQTDGICTDAVGYSLFRKEDKKPQTAKHIAEISADAFLVALLSPIAQNLPISISEKERPKDFSGLNRHTVLHGESLDYGTKTNSLRAISLLNYVSYMLPASQDTEY